MRLPVAIALLIACGTDQSTNLDASITDASPDTTPVIPPKCGTDAWLTYGHDTQRTFATDACITGPLVQKWSYTPTAPTGKTVYRVEHALATTDAIYLAWGAVGSAMGTTADRVTADGARVWTWDSGTDAQFGNWGSVSGSNLILDDDGVFFVDTATGNPTASTGVDWWGQTMPAPNGGVYCVTASKADGPGVLVASLDTQAKILWKANEDGTQCKQGITDVMGGIALDGGLLFYAPVYKTTTTTQPKFLSGVYAFDVANGQTKWSVPSQPASAISAGGGLLYLVEGSELVARKQADGSKVYSAPLSKAGSQAPVLANDLVIVADGVGVDAFDAKTGAPRWSTPVAGAAAPVFTGFTSNACSGIEDLGGPIITTMAAALPTKTLVITGTDGVHILGLADGIEQWKGAVGAHPHDPILVGKRVYVVDSAFTTGYGYAAGPLLALTAP